jgi:hypothetical protein
MAITQMGGNSVYTNTYGIKFNDGSTQTSAALAPPSGNANGNPLVSDGSTPPNLSWANVFIGLLEGFLGFVTGTVGQTYAALVTNASGLAQMSVAHDGGVGVNVQATTDPTQSGLFIQPPADANSTNVTPGQITLGTSGGNSSLVGCATESSTLILPIAPAGPGQFLITDGGNPEQTLEWADAASGAAVPSSVGSAGRAGQIAYDDDYIYVCWAANAWKRAALSTW